MRCFPKYCVPFPPKSPIQNFLVERSFDWKNPLENPIFPYQDPISKFVHLLKSCRSPSQLTQIHAQILATGISDNTLIISKVIRASDLDNALLIFNQIGNPQTFIWNTMIQAYSDSNSPNLAISFYIRMLVQGANPNNYTFPSLFKACTDLLAFSEGTQIHSHVVKLRFDLDQFIQSSLVHMYSSFGDLGSAHQVFDEIPVKNVVSWTTLVSGYAKFGDLEVGRQVFDAIPRKDTVAWSALIAGYVQRGRFKEGLSVFNEMQIERVKPNESVLVSVLSACAHLGALDLGRWVHFYVERFMECSLSVNLGTALVDMYAKCGLLSAALSVFYEIPRKNILSWNVMMGGFAIYGHGKSALGLFSRMLRVGLRPDKVTFLEFLGACSHGGLIEEGRIYFDSMSKFFSINPGVEHYACMVDLFARAGLLEEARELVWGMPMRPDACVWGALLGGCRIHGDVRLGALVGEQLIELEPDHAGRYVLLSNIYALSGRWEEARHVRELMAKRGVKMRPGCSSIEIGGVVHEFVVGERAHPEYREINLKLEEMSKRLKMAGHSAETRNVLYDMDEEDKEVQLSFHSEKLAIAFGLISTPSGTPIRIIKNLRVCSDCHVATKMLSMIYEREIIVRDSRRFHHFRGGSCSCLDYW